MENVALVALLVLQYLGPELYPLLYDSAEETALEHIGAVRSDLTVSWSW